VLDQEIDEGAHLRRHVPPALEGDVDAQARQVPLVEHRHQAAGHDVLVEDVFGLHQDAEPVERRRAQHLAIVGLEQALDLDHAPFAAAAEGKLFGVVAVGVEQQIVRGQLVDALRRAAPVEIARRGGEDAPGLGQAADGDVGVVLVLARADRDIDVVVDQVVVPVGRDHLDRDLGIALGVGAQERRDVVHAEGQRRGDAQRAHRIERLRIDGRIGIAQIGQDGLAAVVVALARLGQREAARVALHEPHAQPRLQRDQVPAGGGVRQAHGLGRARQAAQLRRLYEQLDLGPAIHAAS
jgi:hypothetical protein